MKDDLGNRMKEQYENRTRYFLPRRTYTLIRLDGKSFHTYTRGCERPFDEGLCADMDATAVYLCENVQGAKFAYVQSDEISILLTDFEKVGTDAYFDGNIQKIASVTASMAAAKFNQLRLMRKVDPCSEDLECVLKGDLECVLAAFDSRVFTIPDPIEVENMFIWRQQDAVRNSVSMLAQSLYSHKELQNKNNSEMQEMIHQKGQNWNDIYGGYKRGRMIVKEEYDSIISGPLDRDITVVRNRWVSTVPPTFTQERECLRGMIPQYGVLDTEQ